MSLNELLIGTTTSKPWCDIIAHDVKSATITPTSGITGVTDGSNAAAGLVGEYKQNIFGPLTISASGVYQNMTNLLLQPGDWDVTLQANWAIDNKVDQLAVGLSLDQTASSFSDLVEGSNNCRYTSIGLTSGIVAVPTSVSNLRISLTVATYIQVKVTSTYSSAVPTAYGRVSARRVR
jgi:hypothetical protein